MIAAAVIGGLLPLQPGMARAAAVPLVAEHAQVLINLQGGLPGRWESCARTCREDDAPRTLLGPMVGQPHLAWEVAGDPAAGQELDNLEYTAETSRVNGQATVILSSRTPFHGMQLIHRYRLEQDGRLLAASLQVPPGARLRLVGGPELAGTPLDGLASVYTRVRAVTIDADGQSAVGTDDGKAGTASAALPAGTWAGIRGRFWTVLLQSSSGLQLSTSGSGDAAAGEPVSLALGRDGGPEDGSGGSSGGARGTLVDWRIYGGPIAAPELEKAAPELGGMLYAGLWEWLRLLATGMRHLLDFLQGFVGNWGVAIMLLSLSVKILMWPLTWIAERWQADVNRQRSLLAPELAVVKRELKGEAAHNRTLEIYRQHGISPLYTLKSLGGFLVQIPVFIAAFDMLGEHFALSGARFLWVPDLALPDAVMALPFAIPGLGGSLNLLPVLMALLTVTAARLQEDPSLAPELRGGQRLRLYGMALLFFVLLYTFPAGMVLYWTTNNLLHVLKILAGRLITGRRGGDARPARAAG